MRTRLEMSVWESGRKIDPGYLEQAVMVLSDSPGAGAPGVSPNVACCPKSILFMYSKLTTTSLISLKD